MRTIKVELVRSIVTEETYFIAMNDEDAKKFLNDAKTADKETLADMTDDAFQKSKRNINTMARSKQNERTATDKVTYIKFRDATGEQD